MTTITSKPPGIFTLLVSPARGSRMVLVRIFPDKSGYDQRTYECPPRAHEITEMVQFVKAD